MEIVKNKTGRSRPNAPRRQPDARLVHSVACGRGIVRRLSGPMNSCRRPPEESAKLSKSVVRPADQECGAGHVNCCDPVRGLDRALNRA